MQKAFEDIVEMLEQEETLDFAQIKFTGYEAFRKSIEIVNKVAEEYKSNDGWISCSERLPEEKENPITRDYYVYPVMVDLGKRSDIRYYGYGDGHWWHGLTKMDGLVTHWMDIKPYQPKICVNTECPYNENAECPAAEGCGGFEQK